MRRIAVLLTVVALVAVMMAITIASAFAAQSVYRCTTDGNSYYLVYEKDVKEMRASGDTCVDTSTL